MKYFKYILIALLTTIFLSFIVFPRQHPKDKSKIYHYKAIKLLNEGKIDKAIKKLEKAISIYKDNEYLLDLATIYLNKGDKKKAFKYASMIKPGEKATPIEKVTLLAWKGVFGINNGIRLHPHDHFRSALRLMNHHQIDSAALHTVLYNNAAVSRLFYQSYPGKEKDNAVHLRDVKFAREFLQKSLIKQPDNCVAAYNLTVVDIILNSLDKKMLKKEYGYVKPCMYEDQVFPLFDCVLKEQTKNKAILQKLNEEEEVLFILDISGSMLKKMPSGETRFQVMKDIVIDLIQNIDKDIELGVLSLGQDCENKPFVDIPVGAASREELVNAVASLRPMGSTPLNPRLRSSVSKFTEGNIGKSIFMCSDGINTCGSESTCLIADELADKNIKVHALGVLLEDSESMKEYAIYDCITKATYGEMLGIKEDSAQFELKTEFITQQINPLVLKVDDLINSQYTPTEIETITDPYLGSKEFTSTEF